MNNLLKENPEKSLNLIKWARGDDACEIQKDGKIVSYHCTDNGLDELEYIIDRLRTLYALGCTVQTLTIEISELND